MAETLDVDPWLAAWLVARVPALGGRVFPWGAPQAGSAKGAKPYVLYTEIHFHQVTSMRGPTGLCKAITQVDVFSDNKTQAKDIAGLISGTRAAPGLSGFQGFFTRAGVGRIGVQYAGIASPGFSESYEPEHAQDVNLYRVSRDYEIWFDQRIYPEV